MCAPSTGRELVARATIEVPLESGSGCSFHYLFSKYNADGATARIETYFAGASHETAVASLVDDSAPGSAFVIGGARGNGTGAAFGPWLGKVNRLYVYHAPGGTFTAADFAAIRAFAKDVTPLP